MGFDCRPIIVHIVQSLEGGGTERFLIALLQALHVGRFRHSVITLRGAGPLASQLPGDVACYPMEVSGRSWLAGWRAAQAIAPLRPAVIHARNTGCWGDAVIAGVLTPCARVVLGFHGLDNASHFARRQRFVMRWGLRWGARFTSVSNAGASKMRREAGIRSEQIDILPNGVKVANYGKRSENERREVRQSLAISDSEVVVGTVGSLTAVKGHAQLLEAFAHLAGTMKDMKLLIVGDGPLRGALTRQAADAGVADRVCFTGWRDDVALLHSAMDVYVCASATEGMSNAVVEAMASGLSIVATDVGDNALLLRDGRDGLIIKSQSPKAIAQAVRRFAESPGLRRELGEAARVRAQAFEFDRAVQNYERYYGDLVASKARRRRTMVGWRGMRRSQFSDCT